jgi:hypothetical protein
MEYLSYSKMATEISRVTLFRVLKEDDRPIVLAEFKKMQKNALKVQ